MKLQDLATPQQSKQTAKVFESYFGQPLSIDRLSRNQVRGMLQKVRGLIREHRSTREFHRSEKNPSYLKLVVLETALETRIRETAIVPGGVTGQQTPDQQAAARRIAAGTGQAAKAGVLDTAIDSAVQGKTLSPAEKQVIGKTLSTVQQAAAKDTRLQQMLKTAGAQTMEAKRRARRLREASEVQQAQVVLAAQDMVDKMQKMLEEITAMQFKDLPALVDSIKNEVGAQQATQFNADATAALSGLVQNLQAGKQQMEAALGVVTGQAQATDDLGMATDLPPAPDQAAADLGAAGADLDAAAADMEEPEAGAGQADLGRGRR